MRQPILAGDCMSDLNARGAGGGESGLRHRRSPTGRRSVTCRRTATKRHDGWPFAARAFPPLREPLRSPCSVPRTEARAAAFPRSLRRIRSSCRSRPARGGSSASLILFSVSDFIWISANSMSSWMSASELSTASNTSFLPPRRFRTDVANLALDFRLKLSPTLIQHLLEFGVSGLWFTSVATFVIRSSCRRSSLPVLRRGYRPLELPSVMQMICHYALRYQALLTCSTQLGRRKPLRNARDLFECRTPHHAASDFDPV